MSPYCPTTSVPLRLVRPDSVVFDVGANIGFHALICARLTGAGGAVGAFEPFPDSAQLIAKNSALTGFQHVHVIQAALSDSPGTGTLRLGDSSALHSIVADDENLQVENIGVPVTFMTLDEASLEHKVSPDLIIIDVEGAELQVLAGALNTLAKHKPDILLELHWKQMELERFLVETLKLLGYYIMNIHFRPYQHSAVPLREHVILTTRLW